MVVALRVLLTGASGLVGTWMRRSVPNDVDLVCARHRTDVAWATVVDLDIRDRAAVHHAVGSIRPALIIHLAYAVDEPTIVGATRTLAGSGVPVMLASTDAVFSGDGRVRSETDRPDPRWDYGRWKAQAEEIVLACPGSTVVRLPLMCSIDPSDATTTAIRAANAEGRRLGWYRGETRMPAWASDVSQGMWSISVAPDPGGVWHLSGPDPMTRSQLGAALAGRLGVPDPGDVVDPPPRNERPHDLRLSDSRARSAIGWDPSLIE